MKDSPRVTLLETTVRNRTLAITSPFPGAGNVNLFPQFRLPPLKPQGEQINCDTEQLSSSLKSFWIIIKGYEKVLDITVKTQTVVALRVLQCGWEMELEGTPANDFI